MPARRRNFLRSRKRIAAAKKTDNHNRYFKYSKFVLIAFLLLLLIFFVKILTTQKYWDPANKLAIAVQEETSGDVSILILDAPQEEITKITIPGNTEVEVADNLGIWKLKAVWDLGRNEKQGGKLLTKTLTNYFKFPVYVWSNSGLNSIVEGNVMSLLKPINTNLSIGDRVKILLFAINVNHVNREDINLSNTNIIKKTTLRDGEEGFILSGFDSPRVSTKFSDYRFTSKTVRVQIKDATGNASVSNNVGKILESLGAKVSLISKEAEEDMRCEVSGTENLREAVKLASVILGCNEAGEATSGNFDIVLKLGNKYF